MRVLARQLRLEKLKLGLFSGGFTANPTGYMVVAFEGREAQDYARAFFETFGPYAYGNQDEKPRARKLLQDLAVAALQEWGSSERLTP